MKFGAKRTVFLIVGAVCAVAAACGWLRPRRPPNVILVSIDTLRSDHLGCYGYDRDTSPTLDRLAREGVRFANVASTTSWTLPAHAALFTGLFDPLHGVTWDPMSLDGSRITLAEVFAAHGYRTGAVFTGVYLLPRFGLDQGFEEYYDATIYDKRLSPLQALLAAERGRTTDGAMAWVADWLERRDARPLFLFIHLFDVHSDYVPPPPYDRMFDPNYSGTATGRNIFRNNQFQPDMDPRDLRHVVALYDGEIRYVDEHGVAKLLSLLEREGLLADTVLVLTSDHGEEFFEHGEIGHRHNLHRETIRVPLILWGPDRLPSGRVVETFVRLVDVMPTLLDLAGLPPSPEAVGESLLPLLEDDGEPAPREAFLQLKRGRLHLEGLETSTEKLLVDYGARHFAYYDLQSDPAEERPKSDLDDDDVATACKKFEATRRALNEIVNHLPRSQDSPAPLDETTRQRLDSLGYLQEGP